LEAIQEDIKRKDVQESRIRKGLYGILTAMIVFYIVSYGNQRVLQDNVQKQGEHIEVLRKNVITYETFVLFNRTYELQLEETQALLSGDMDRLMIIQSKYRELRSMIVQKKPSITRGGGTSGGEGAQ
jgi:hypothetical protein